MTKKCKLCGKEFELEFFEKDKRAPDGHSSRCLDCARECKRVSALKHRDERLERQRKYREEYPEEYKAKKHAEYERNKDRYKSSNKKYYEENKEWFIQMTNECRNRRYEKNPEKKLNDYYRHIISSSLQGRSSDAMVKRAEGLLGCSLEFYKGYLESLFTENMSWGNYSNNGWHIDHLRPCCTFDLTDTTQVQICFNYRNTHPMWGRANLEKGAIWTKTANTVWEDTIGKTILASLL